MALRCTEASISSLNTSAQRFLTWSRSRQPLVSQRRHFRGQVPGKEHAKQTHKQARQVFRSFPTHFRHLNHLAHQATNAKHEHATHDTQIVYNMWFSNPTCVYNLSSGLANVIHKVLKGYIEPPRYFGKFKAIGELSIAPCVCLGDLAVALLP